MICYKTKTKIALRIVAVALVCVFTLSGIPSYAITDTVSDFALAPPIATKPPCQIVQKSNGSYDVVTNTDVIESWDKETTRSVKADETLGKAFRNRWAYMDVSYLIAQMLILTQEHKLRNPKDILIPLIKKHIRNRDGLAETMLEGYDIDGIAEVREGQAIRGFSLPVTRNGTPAYRLVYNLQGGDTVISMSNGMKVYVIAESVLSKQETRRASIAVPSFASFVKSQLKTNRDRKINRDIESNDKEVWFPKARVRGFAGNAWYLHERTERLVQLDEYGLTFDELGLTNKKRLEVYPFSHAKSIKAEYAYLQSEAQKRGYNTNPASLIIANPLLFNESDLEPYLLMGWNIGNFFYAFVAGDTVSDVPTAEEINEAIKFYAETSLPKDKKIQSEYKASATFIYRCVSTYLSPILKDIKGRISLTEIDTYHLYMHFARAIVYGDFYGRVKQNRFDDFSFGVSVGKAEDIILSAIRAHREELLNKLPSYESIKASVNAQSESAKGIKLMKRVPKETFNKEAKSIKSMAVSTISEILQMYKNNPPRTLYQVQQLPNKDDIKGLWENGEKIEFAVFVSIVNGKKTFFALQGDKDGFDIDIHLLKFLKAHPVLFFIHNHPPQEKKAPPADFDKSHLPDIERWYFENISFAGIPSPFPTGNVGIGSDYLGIETVKKMYIYTRERGYVEYDKAEKPIDAKFGCIKFQAYYENGREEELIVNDEDALFGWGVSIVEEQSLYPYRKFIDLIEKGATKIKLTNWDGKYVVWDKYVNFDSMLQEAAPVILSTETEQAHTTNFRDTLTYIQAQPQSQPIIVALGTSWIKGYEKGRYLQYDALNPLVGSIRTYCESKGIPFIVEEDDKLLAHINAERAKEGKADAKVVVLAGKDTVTTDDFATLRNDRENAIVVGVDNQELTTDSYIRLMEMLTLALKLFAGLEISLDNAHITITKDNERHLYIFLPHAEPMDYEQLKMLYEVQKFA